MLIVAFYLKNNNILTRETSTFRKKERAFCKKKEKNTNNEKVTLCDDKKSL
jgi:hypothetical protein